VSFDPLAILKDSGGKDDSEISILNIAMAFSALSHEGINADRYFNHVSKMAADAGARYKALTEAGADDDAGTRLAALKHIIADREGYAGDGERYGDLQNADLMRVIDRRKGMPITLCILYIHVARMNGWMAEGLNFPGHFLARIEHDGARLIFDPFAGCEVLEAPALRQLIKKVRGPNAELLADYYKPCTNRETLLRLQNNVKLRLIEAEDYAAALQSVEWMRMMAPMDYRLLLDAGVLYAKTGQSAQAAESLEKYIMLTPSARDRHDAELMLREIKDSVT
jgi:regulator of sirC expression with transglutaminase-like and TPR domain